MRILMDTFLVLLRDDFTISANLRPLWNSSANSLEFKCVGSSCWSFHVPWLDFAIHHISLDTQLSPALNSPKRVQPQNSIDDWCRSSWGSKAARRKVPSRSAQTTAETHIKTRQPCSCSKVLPCPSSQQRLCFPLALPTLDMSRSRFLFPRPLPFLTPSVYRNSLHPAATSLLTLPKAPWWSVKWGSPSYRPCCA